VLKPFHRITWC